MLYKKLLLTSNLILVICTGVKSQSKIETQQWIKQKFEAYFTSDMTHSGDDVRYSIYEETKNLKVSFNACEMIVTKDCYEREFSTNDIMTGKKKIATYKSTITDVVPISAISDISKGPGVFYINIAQRQVKTYRSTNHDKTRVKVGNSDLCSITMDVHGEDNLFERLVKALHYLMNFCPNHQNTEPF
jgi:hypothetical protein